VERFPAHLLPRLSARRLISVALAILLVGAVFWLFRTSGELLNPSVIRTTIIALGPLGPLALIGALALLLVAPIAPAAVLQIGAGLAFGPLIGFLYTLIADAIGASIGFWLARRWGRALLDPRLSPEMRAQVERLAQRVTWRSVMILRLLPGPAYPLVSFAAGYSRLGFGAYTLASLAGGSASACAAGICRRPGDALTSSGVWAGCAAGRFAGDCRALGEPAFASRVTRGSTQAAIPSRQVRFCRSAQ
jgi:uncharacterized membrane protein YdjX (TVP38/TMEM64 family)